MKKRKFGTITYILPLDEVVFDCFKFVNEIIILQHVDAREIAKILTEGQNKIPDTPSSGLSSEGSVSVDPRNNVLIIQETSSAQIKIIQDLVKTLDQPPKGENSRAD